MVTHTSAHEFVELSRKYPVLDVRSPGEFDHGHIPGAVTFPLFDNDERAEIGTLFKRAGQDKAMQRGLELVGPKIAGMVQQALQTAVNGKILVHCWRGGKRSEAVAGLLGVTGLDVYVLKGGYKQFRNWVLGQFQQKMDLVVIGGPTGSGKTAILQAIGRAGGQILDLEKLADHKGSSFGRLGSTRNVTLTQFENDLAYQLAALDLSKRIWVEDESRTIGSLQIPIAFWETMSRAPLAYVDIPAQARIGHLMEEYGNFSHEELKDAVLRLSRRLGGLRTQQAIQALEEKNADAFMALMLDYYDHAYLHAFRQRPKVYMEKFAFDRLDPDQIAQTLIAAKISAE